MKLLIIAPNLPYPLDSGGNQAQFHLTKFLQEKLEISYLFTLKKGQEKDLEELKKHWNKVNIIPYTQPSTLKFKLNRILLKLREMVIYGKENELSTLSPDIFYTEHFLSFLNQTIAEGDFDSVQTEFYNYLPLVYALPKNIKRIFVQHEIRFVVNQIKKQRAAENSLLKSFNWSKLEAEEIAAMNQYDAVITLTQKDKEKLEHEGVSTSIFASPALIDSNDKRNKCNYQGKLIFVGGSVHKPNVASINWFLAEVWSQILEKHPQTQLHIIGKWDKNIVDDLSSKHKNLHFRGFVEDLQKEMDGTISIIPILIGSGMRMKIIDAANYGSPFVTTSIGVEGMGFENEIDCFIADDTKSFAEQTIALIESESLREKFYANSYKKIQEEYSTEKLTEKRMSVYSSLAQNKAD